MPEIYVIDSPSMPSTRVKRVNYLEYSCGRALLIPYALSSRRCTYIYTGPADDQHEADIKREFNLGSSGIIPALSNKMRDFSGYAMAIEDAFRKGLSDVVLCNSSCPPAGLKALTEQSGNTLAGSVIGVGAKSFQRFDRVRVRINPHLQTYALRLLGRDSILSFRIYINICKFKFRSELVFSERNYKDNLISFCELGFNNYLRAQSRKRFFLSPSGSLIQVPKILSPWFPFFDSRMNDPRFVLIN
jgi:hypothetical protein